MYRQMKRCQYHIFFAVLNMINVYIVPVIAVTAVTSDKALIGLALDMVPYGWFIISVIYGFMAKKIWAPPCCAMLICLPLIFIRAVTGDTIIEKIWSILFILVICFLISVLGAVIGQKAQSIIKRFRKK